MRQSDEKITSKQFLKTTHVILAHSSRFLIPNRGGSNTKIMRKFQIWRKFTNTDFHDRHMMHCVFNIIHKLAQKISFNCYKLFLIKIVSSFKLQGSVAGL